VPQRLRHNGEHPRSGRKVSTDTHPYTFGTSLRRTGRRMLRAEPNQPTEPA
jgi:hypothetical protein